MASYNQDYVPGIIVQLGVFDGTAEQILYISNFANTLGYSPIISNDIVITESFESMNISDIEVHNANGEYDIWLNPAYVFTNRSIKIYVGDRNSGILPSELIFDGLIADIDSRSRTTINFKIRDKMERLNSAISETTLGVYGTWPANNSNKDKELTPLVFGEVCNISPVLIDPAQLEYLVSIGPISGIIEFRDNGFPIYSHPDVYPAQTTARPDNAGVAVPATGKFKLGKKLAGSLTASVQGQTQSMTYPGGVPTYSSTVYSSGLASIIGVLATQYGKASTRLALSELNGTSLSAYTGVWVGLYLDSRMNVIEAINMLAGSIGANVSFSRSGKLGLYRRGSGTVGTNISTITDSDIILNSLEIINKTTAIGSHKLTYCNNYSQQTGLLTGIQDSSKDLFSKEYLEIKAANTTTINNYKLEAEPETYSTLLIDSTQAQAEADRRLALYLSPKIAYKFTGTRKMLGLELGQNVSITHNRFGLNNTTVQVISLTNNWTRLSTEVEVSI